MTKYQKYKLAIISLLSIAFIYVYSQKNRYKYSTAFEGRTPVIIDTKTGTIYFSGSKKKYELKE